jgi:hypothetical protein
VWAAIGIALAREGNTLITTVTWVSIAVLVVVLLWNRLRPLVQKGT